MDIDGLSLGLSYYDTHLDFNRERDTGTPPMKCVSNLADGNRQMGGMEPLIPELMRAPRAGLSCGP